MRGYRYLLGCLASGVLLMTGGCDEPEPIQPGLLGGWTTAGCEFSRSPETMTIGGRTLPVTPKDLDAAIARIDKAGRSEHAASYAGIEVDQERVRAIVYRVPSAPLDDLIRQAAENTCVFVRDAEHGLDELNAWHDRVRDDIAAWKSRGIFIATISARHDGAGVEVGTPDVQRARVELPEHYGRKAPLIVVEQGPVVPIARTSVPTAPPPGG
ncbi:hypothetical protein [Actinoplanes sp. TFC3]|uniref:hypothetical protein n=1 Tax=Actinoplanes sp. TFC3 TaxID=1710355 RepID=UPI000832E835|nr:hypothetical protein [Actinoplanes sp. TFC3]